MEKWLDSCILPISNRRGTWTLCSAMEIPLTSLQVRAGRSCRQLRRGRSLVEVTRRHSNGGSRKDPTPSSPIRLQLPITRRRLHAGARNWTLHACSDVLRAEELVAGQCPIGGMMAPSTRLSSVHDILRLL